MYAMIGTQPDLAYIVSTLGRFNANPSLEHAGVIKRTLRYLRHTQGHRLTHSLVYGGNSCELVRYSDSDWAGDTDTRRSTTGHVAFRGGEERGGEKRGDGGKADPSFAKEKERERGREGGERGGERGGGEVGKFLWCGL